MSALLSNRLFQIITRYKENVASANSVFADTPASIAAEKTPSNEGVDAELLRLLCRHIW